jgi:hypothetical protein
MRELHIHLPKPKFITLFSIAIIVAMFIFGLLIIRNVNKEFAIRQIASSLQEYKYATLSFNNIYSGLPGDITNASFYWKDSTENGNGDKKINPESNELVTAWQQLQLASLLKISYNLTGKWNSNLGNYIFVPGENIPNVSGSDIGYYLSFIPELDGNYFGIGKMTNQIGNLTQPALTPNDAYALDLMLDDGYPDKGILTAIKSDNGDCFAAGEYKKEAERKECSLLLKF